MTVDVDENELVEEEHYAMAGQEHRDVITRLYEGLKLLFDGRDDRLVMAEVDLYPPGEQVKMIPDIAVVFGVAQSVVNSYRVGRSGPAPTVVLEVVSRWETEDARTRKLERYATIGVLEVWFLHMHPPVNVRYSRLDGGWQADTPVRCDLLDGVSFPAVEGVLELHTPDGRPFPLNTASSELQARAAVERALAEAQRADAESERADAEAERAEAEAERAAEEAVRARATAGLAHRLATRLRELGVDPDTV